MKSSAKILVIGLDSADPSLLNDWSGSGDLPVLQALRGRSRWGTLSSPLGLADDGAWASFSTCVSPARHGRYFTRSLSSGSYDNPPFRDEDLKFETFWSTLDRAGLRMAVIDVPKTPLAKTFDGIQIRDWIVHGRDGDIASWPKELAAELFDRFGPDTADDWSRDGFLCEMTQLDQPRLMALAKELSRSVQHKRQVSLELLGRGNWDLYLVVFKETHCVGHQFWHLLDETRPAYDPSLARQLGNPIKEVYRAIDTAIGDLLELAGPDTYVIVFSDLGMAANYTGEHLLDEILVRLEPAAPPWHENPSADMERTLGAAAEGSAMGRMGPEHRRAIQVQHNEISGAIRINLRGREPHGLVRPGSEFEDLCATLSRDLLNLENAATGEGVVQEVLRTSEIFEGGHLDMLPDLFVVWKRDAPIERVRSDKFGELELHSPRVRTGNHVKDGVFLLCGPGIEPEEQSAAASITDIGPTIAAILGSPLSDVDGKSLLS